MSRLWGIGLTDVAYATRLIAEAQAHASAATPDCPYYIRRLAETLEEALEELRGLREIAVSPPRPLFTTSEFTLHSGEKSAWKIDCDALTEADYDTLAHVALSILPPFSKIEFVPTGGQRFAKAIQRARGFRPFSPSDPVLIVDDVCTTGQSLEAQRAGRPWPPPGAGVVGVVIFARGHWPLWVKPLFCLGSLAEELAMG